MTEFPAAPLERTARSVTIFYVVMVAIATVIVTVNPQVTPLTRLVVIGLLVISFVGAFATSPTGYALDGEHLLVRRRLLPPLRVARSGAAARVPLEALTGSVRLLGGGGIWGYKGRWSRRGMGPYRAYVTDRNCAVACETEAGAVVVSPSDPTSFLDAWKKRKRGK